MEEAFLDMCCNANILPLLAHDMYETYTTILLTRKAFAKRNVLMAACAFHVLATNGAGRTMKEISLMTGVSDMRAFGDYLSTHFPHTLDVYAHELMSRWCAELNIDRTKTQKLINEVRNVVCVATNEGWIRCAAAMSAGCLYVLNYELNLQLTEEDLARVTNTSIATMKRYAVLYTKSMDMQQ